MVLFNGQQNCSNLVSYGVVLYIPVLAQYLYLPVHFTVLLPVPIGLHVGRRHIMLQWAWRLGHADYPDRLFWYDKWKTNLGTSSSPVLHKTSRIFINLNLLFVRGGGCWPTGFNVIEHLADWLTDKQQSCKWNGCWSLVTKGNPFKRTSFDTKTYLHGLGGRNYFSSSR